MISWYMLLILPFAGLAQFEDGQDPEKALKDYDKAYFPVGVAIRPQSVKGEEAALILKHF